MAKLCYIEIKHSDWMFQVTGLFLTNQSVLNQSSIVMLFKNLFMTLVPGLLLNGIGICYKHLFQASNELHTTLY